MYGSKMKHKKRKTKVKSKSKPKKKKVLFKKIPTLVPKREPKKETFESFNTKKHNLNYYYPMRDLAMPTEAPPGLRKAEIKTISASSFNSSIISVLPR